MSEREGQFQERVVQTLSALGYTVMVSSARSFGQSQKKAASGIDRALREAGVYVPSDALGKAGAAMATSKGYGADKGIPDLLVCHADWPCGTIWGAELKGESTKVSKEQEAMAGAGFYGIYRGPSMLALLEALAEFHTVVGKCLEKPKTPTRLLGFISGNMTALRAGRL